MQFAGFAPEKSGGKCTMDDEDRCLSPSDQKRALLHKQYKFNPEKAKANADRPSGPTRKSKGKRVRAVALSQTTLAKSSVSAETFVTPSPADKVKVEMQDPQDHTARFDSKITVTATEAWVATESQGVAEPMQQTVVKCEVKTEPGLCSSEDYSSSVDTPRRDVKLERKANILRPLRQDGACITPQAVWSSVHFGQDGACITQQDVWSSVHFGLPNVDTSMHHSFLEHREDKKRKADSLEDTECRCDNGVQVTRMSPKKSKA
jgi:hypothetical protein